MTDMLMFLITLLGGIVAVGALATLAVVVLAVPVGVIAALCGGIWEAIADARGRSAYGMAKELAAQKAMRTTEADLASLRRGPTQTNPEHKSKVED